MGHSKIARDYHLLQRRLDSTVTGAPYSETLMKILELLFSPDEAGLARQLPMKLKPIQSIADGLKMPVDELSDSITDMARRGLVLDMEIKGHRFVMLAPVVIGFFEFTFMRTSNELPMKELAELFEKYMGEEDKFAHSVFQRETQLGRSLIHEEALKGDFTEILDWERATCILENAKIVAVSLCACRHHQSHLNKSCDRLQRACLTFDYAAKPLLKAGLVEEITNREAMSILEECKRQGMAQTGDNVKHRPAFICNCCGCCCGMIRALKTFHIKNAIVSSNWIMEVDLQKCQGCGKCAKACPIGAIELKKGDDASLKGAIEKKQGTPKKEGEEGKKRWAEVDQSLCLGCGVCYSVCKFGGVELKPRVKRVYTPETSFDRVMAMAIERGKLAPLLFDDPQKFSHRAMGRIAALLEKSPPFKAAMAVKPLRSAFLNTLVRKARKKTGISEL